jgi:uncharacterized membrane protein
LLGLPSQKSSAKSICLFVTFTSNIECNCYRIFLPELLIMPKSTLSKFVLAPVLLSTTVLVILTLPLCFFGKKTVTVQFQEEPVFQGQLRDISTPYLCLASVLSLGAGVASIAFTGWRRSSRKSSQIEAQLSDLTRSIQEKEAQIEALQFSESQLVDTQLPTILPEEALTTSSTSQIGQTNVRSEEVEELNLQLQQIMTQMASVQAALSATEITVSSAYDKS